MQYDDGKYKFTVEDEMIMILYFAWEKSMINSNDFMEYADCRNMMIQEKIEECLSLVRAGNFNFEIDSGDLTESEIEYVKREVERRYRRKIY